MRDSFGDRRLIFKNTEETRRSLPGSGGASGVWFASGVLAREAMGIWVMDCVFTRPAGSVEWGSTSVEK
ncbi:MAG: hypothetical protein ING65_13740 [Rhodocyclaceae bacterium]|jgi:hypothetical protein|nr:hypothetical protein [Rhodocyclaceae bacterium]